MKKIYRIVENGCLLLVENDDYVINGHWHLRSLPKHLSVEYVMDAPCEGHYNDVLHEANKIISKQEK